MGRPRARRVMRTPNGVNCWRRYRAVASPSMLGLVARITSVTPPSLHPLHQRPDLQILRADALDRREHAVQHVVTPAEPAGALERQHIQRLFHHAQAGRVTPGVGADLAHLVAGGGDVEADRAHDRLRLERRQRIGQFGGKLLRGAQQEESQPGGGFRSDARQAFKSGDQVLDGFG